MGKCEELGHDMYGQKHIKNDKENYLIWHCTKCNHTLIMDFKTGEERGGAMVHQCRGSSWL